MIGVRPTLDPRFLRGGGDLMTAARNPVRTFLRRAGRTPSRALVPMVIVTSLSCASCTDGPSPGGWEGAVDTLSSGAVRVRSPERGVWDSTTAWRLVEASRIGGLEGPGPEVFASVSGIAVDTLRRIYVLDRQADEVRVFGPDGSHIRTFGREGQGPGELEDPIGLTIQGGDRLWVVDPGNGRYSVFDTTGAFLASHPRRLGSYWVPWRGGFDESGRFWEATVAMGTGESVPALVVLDSSLVPRDTVWIPAHEEEVFELATESFRVAADVPFASRQIWTAAPDGTIWTALTGEYRLALLNRQGDTLRIVEKDATPIPVSPEERAHAVRELRWFTSQGGEIDPSRIPNTKPALSSVHAAPDGHLWVVPALPAGLEGSAFDIFDPDGKYLGRLLAPSRILDYPEPVFGGRYLYGHVRGELDVSHVVKLHVIGAER